jgi:sulfate adenylyltransferase subunit 2
LYDYLKDLENESIYILREAIAEAENPVIMYSIGKDSGVMLHLALKAFYPIKPPVRYLHVDTTWKFKEMIEFRNKIEKKYDIDILKYTNQDGLKHNINPFTHGSSIYTNIMKTDALKQALNLYKFDIIIGGARREEEKSRAKERIFSFRDVNHSWNPKEQRPELWDLYNTKRKPNESFRVFPLSNWTEVDIWRYILMENIDVVPLYFAKERPVVNRNGQLIYLNDDRFKLEPGEEVVQKKVRFRTLGCYPLTAAIESDSETLEDIVHELETTHYSERIGRLIDFDQSGSMEKKKHEGYF